MSKKRTQQHFNEMLRQEMSDADFREVIANLKRHAQNNEGWAIREILDRVLGKPQQSMDLSVEHQATVLDLPALRDELVQLMRSDPEVRTRLLEGKVIEQDGTPVEAGTPENGHG